MKVADYIIKELSAQGVGEVFVVYGSANGDMIDAFVRTPNIRYVCVMHEQAGGFAAEAYAKVTKNIGVALATSGPGGHNFVTPIGNCYYDSVPCLFITGQVNSKFMRPDESIRQIGFQETDIVSIVKPITKYAKMVTDPMAIGYELAKAIDIAKSGRPGPVLLDLPLNVQKANINIYQMLSYVKINERFNPYDAIEQVVDHLISSERPAIIVGGGVKFANAEEPVRHLIKQLGIPAFPTWNAVDVIASDFPYYGGRIGTYGGAGRNFGIQNADLILFLGSRLSGRITGGNVKSFGREATKIMVDIDKAMLQPQLQQLPMSINIHCDISEFINGLITRLEFSNQYRSSKYLEWLKRVLTWRDKYDFVRPEMFEPNDIVHPYAFLRLLSQEMDKNDVILGDCGGNIVAMNHSFEYKTGQIHITNNGNSPMGFSFAAGIGACLAHKNKGNVVAIIGDGGFNMNIQELQTLKNYDIPLKCIILNNHIYGITKAFQEVNFEGRCEACGPVGYNPPDFVRICQAYNIPTMVIPSGRNYEFIRNRIQKFLKRKGPCIMDVNCHEYHTYEAKVIGWSTPIEDMYPYLSDEEFNENMIVKPLHREKFGEK